MFCRSVRSAPHMARGLLVRFVACLPDVVCFVVVFVVTVHGSWFACEVCGVLTG